jgi:hypothetical protein
MLPLLNRLTKMFVILSGGSLPRRIYALPASCIGPSPAEPPLPMTKMDGARVNVQIRRAVAADVPRLREIIEASVRGLQSNDYSPAQIEGALQSVYGVDIQLIADGTYLIAEEYLKPIR